MIRLIKKLQNKCRLSYCAVVCVIIIAFSSLVITSTSKALEILLPSADINIPWYAPIPCAVPLTLGVAISDLGSGVIAGITQATTNISTAIAVESASTTGGLTVSISGADGYINTVLTFFKDLWLGNQMLRDTWQDMASNFSVLEANQERMIGSLIDATEQNRVIRNLQETEFKESQILTASDSLKRVATLIGGLQRSKNIQEGYNLVNAGVLLERTAAKAEGQDTAGSGEEEDFSGGSHIDINKRWNKYVELYCDKNSNAGNAGCDEDGILVSKDINVTDTVFSRETIEITDQDMADAVNELIINISEPFMPKPFPSGLHDDPKEGRPAILALEGYKSKRQVVLDAVNHVVSRRLPGSQMGSYMKNLRNDVGINDESLAGITSYNPSYNEIMHFMMSERFRTGAYTVEQVDTPENNARERVVQSAFFLMQLNDMVDLLDKQAMLLTAQVSSNVKERYGDQDAAIEQMKTSGR